MAIPNLWTTQGRLTRSEYALIGFCFFAIKLVVDTAVSALIFHRAWGLENYLTPIDAHVVSGVMDQSVGLFDLTMVAIALPFIWVGISCTLRRLRDAALPLWLLVGFLLPIVNLLLVTVLCFVPTMLGARPAEEKLERERRFPPAEDIPFRKPEATRAVLISGIAGLLFALLATIALKNGYGLGLFVALPFCIGFAAVLLYARSGNVSLGQAAKVSMTAAMVPAAGLILLGAEGLICLVMAAPLALFIAFCGGITAHELTRYLPSRTKSLGAFWIVLLAVPSIMGGESAIHREPRVYVVRSSVVVNAPPEAVWKQVIAFSEIPAPREWMFRAGIAYPIRAEMIGHGIGAERHCIFSTGAFVEPIQVWDEPRLLKFSVTSNPPPMNELSPYRRIAPRHLHGFLESEGGQFRLAALPGARTLLEGTTWYKHGLWPAEYWKVWSDAIIHKIHMRVLEHIKEEVEGVTRAG